MSRMDSFSSSGEKCLDNSSFFDSVNSSSDSNDFCPGTLIMGVSDENGEIQKSIGNFSFPWKEVIQHGYSSDYVRCLLSEMTPYAVAETEYHVVVVYSPAKLIGGSEIANLVDGKRSFIEEDSNNSNSYSPEKLPPTSPIPSPSKSIFSKLKQWLRLST